MSKNDLTIKELIDVKSEIKDFVSSKFSDVSELDRNNIIFVVKKIVFLKYLVRQVNHDYRFNALISDIMYLIRSIKNGEERYYYLNLRSIIEHSLRIVNNIDSIDTVTNNEIIENTKNLIKLKGISVNISLIKAEYTKSCLYVHGNEKAGMNLALYYQSSIECEGSIKEISSKLNILVKLLKELFDLILISQNNIVDTAFFRRKTVLKYLLVASSYSVFEAYKVE